MHRAASLRAALRTPLRRSLGARHHRNRPDSHSPPTRRLQSPIPINIFVDEIEQAGRSLRRYLGEHRRDLAGRWLCRRTRKAALPHLFGLRARPACSVSSICPSFPTLPIAFPSDYLQLQQNISAQLRRSCPQRRSSSKCGTGVPTPRFCRVSLLRTPLTTSSPTRLMALDDHRSSKPQKTASARAISALRCRPTTPPISPAMP